MRAVKYGGKGAGLFKRTGETRTVLGSSLLDGRSVLQLANRQI